MIDAVVVALGIGFLPFSSAVGVIDSPAGETATAGMRRQAKALEPLVESQLAKTF